MVRGQVGSASLPVSRSISANVMPSGTSNGTLGRPAVAAFMNAVQIGSAACVPLSDDRLVVVEAHPDHRQQLGREADEPGVAQVVGRAGLAGGVEREARGARAGGGAFVEDAAHHVGDEVGRVFARGALDVGAFGRSSFSAVSMRWIDVSGRTRPPFTNSV